MEDCMDTDKNATIEAWQFQHEKAIRVAHAESARIERERRERAERQAAEYANHQQEESDDK